MHTRAAVSVNSLPLGVSVEVDAIFEINWVFIYQHCNM
jgi:enamine deaminase RidA (YjgF/YER057c/UK114 family)